MPEFLERRYGVRSRTLMAVYMMIAYVGVAMAAVLVPVLVLVSVLVSAQQGLQAQAVTAVVLVPTVKVKATLVAVQDLDQLVH
jgi:uncharacterized sodium:solute symporter family permease YidK